MMCSPPTSADRFFLPLEDKKAQRSRFTRENAFHHTLSPVSSSKPKTKKESRNSAAKNVASLETVERASATRSRCCSTMMFFYLWSFARLFVWCSQSAKQIKKRSESVKVAFLFFPFFFYSSFFLFLFFLVVSILERERKGWCLRCHGLNTLLLYCVTFVTDGNAIFSIDPTRRAHIIHGLFRARHEGGEGEEKEDYPTKKKESSSSTTTTTGAKRRTL